MGVRNNFLRRDFSEDLSRLFLKMSNCWDVSKFEKLLAHWRVEAEKKCKMKLWDSWRRVYGFWEKKFEPQNRPTRKIDCVRIQSFFYMLQILVQNLWNWKKNQWYILKIREDSGIFKGQMRKKSKDLKILKFFYSIRCWSDFSSLKMFERKKFRNVVFQRWNNPS